MTFDIYSIGHVGLCRTENEDNYFILQGDAGDTKLAMVADGIGGHSNGSVASWMSCRRVLTRWRQAKGWEISDAEKALELVSESLEDANFAVFERNRRENNPLPMGSTVLAAIFTADTAGAAGAGDSRMYCFDPDKDEFIQLSIDDKYISEGDDAKSGKEFSNVLTRAVGLTRGLELHHVYRELKPGLRFLLCSDGLYNEVADADMAQILKKSADARDAASSLVAQALINGGKDNVTVICVFVS